MTRLRPFFMYYGSKFNIAHLYPVPTHTRVIEPFAGSASYSLLHYDKDVVLFELDPVIANLWKYLIRVKESEILGLPTEVTNLRVLDCCEEARSLIGLCFSAGNGKPRSRMSPRGIARVARGVAGFWGSIQREIVASQLKYIRHWQVYNCSYRNIPPGLKGTWFVDPPYSGPAGRAYKKNTIDYEFLGQWCQQRQGQVIVCEGVGGEWLPFNFLTTAINTKGKPTQELVWSNTE